MNASVEEEDMPCFFFFFKSLQSSQVNINSWMKHKYMVKVSFGWRLRMQFAEQKAEMFFGMKCSQLILSC